MSNNNKYTIELENRVEALQNMLGDVDDYFIVRKIDVSINDNVYSSGRSLKFAIHSFKEDEEVVCHFVKDSLKEAFENPHIDPAEYVCSMLFTCTVENVIFDHELFKHFRNMLFREYPKL